MSLEFAKDAKDDKTSRKFYVEAVNRFADIVATYSESPYAPKSQYKKAQSLEKMGEIDRACEEYVKLSYRYPEHELIADTIAALGSYFSRKGQAMKKEYAATEDPVEAEKIILQSKEMFKTAAEVFGRLGRTISRSQSFGPHHGPLRAMLHASGTLGRGRHDVPARDRR